MPADFMINGVYHDFASLEHTIAGVSVPEITEISYKERSTRTKVRAQPRHAVARTGGRSEPEASISMLKHRFDRWVVEMGDGFGLVEFDYLVTYRARGSGLYVTDTLIACCIVEPDMGMSEGDDGAIIKVGLDVMRIKWNGKYMLPVQIDE